MHLRHDDREAGSMSVELVIITPLLLLFALFVIACGRIAMADISVQTAADSAARDASLARTDSESTENATGAANRSIAQAGFSCQSLQIAVDSSGVNAQLGTIGKVSTTVSCTVDLSDIALPGLPGSRTITATGTSPVDPYRERS